MPETYLSFGAGAFYHKVRFKSTSLDLVTVIFKRLDKRIKSIVDSVKRAVETVNSLVIEVKHGAACYDRKTYAVDELRCRVNPLHTVHLLSIVILYSSF